MQEECQKKKKKEEKEKAHIEKKTIDQQFESWFLEYASYVVLDRAIPHALDGMKPVQRRILYSMKELNDGRYNKAANIIGHVMRYHPHGDAAIAEAMVKIAQKGFLIDMQGNWGNPQTADKAAAPRYIEARLSPFAEEILFEDEITSWQSSYDGRNKEPKHLPVKFPILLVHGVEGIAVGMSTKILPHNPNEIIKALIASLQGYSLSILPDLPSGGTLDCSDYRAGRRGGRVKVRAQIDILDQKTLLITSIPYGTNTGQIISSILNAQDKGLLKVKRIEDNTAEDISIRVELHSGASTHSTKEALFAHSDCEILISSNCCVISENKPQFLSVDDLIHISAENIKKSFHSLLTKRLEKLLEKKHFAILEKIFIAHKIYKTIENCKSFEEIIESIKTKFIPYRKDLIKEPSHEDFAKLTELKIKRISQWDHNSSLKKLTKLEAEIRETNKHLKKITDYTIKYFQSLSKRYGSSWHRTSKIESFTAARITQDVAKNVSIYLKRKEGFIGTQLIDGDFVFETSLNADLLVITENGTLIYIKPCDKKFIAPEIKYVFKLPEQKKNLELQVLYYHQEEASTFAKRFEISNLTKGRSYKIVNRCDQVKISYLSLYIEGLYDRITFLPKSPQVLAPQLSILDFSKLDLETRSGQGQFVFTGKAKNIKSLRSSKKNTLAKRYWFDRKTSIINQKGKGSYLGKLKPEDKIIVFYPEASFEMISPQDNFALPTSLFTLRIWSPKDLISIVINDLNEKKAYLYQQIIGCTTVGTKSLLSGKERAKLIGLSSEKVKELSLTFFCQKKKLEKVETILIDPFDLNNEKLKLKKTLLKDSLIEVCQLK